MNDIKEVVKNVVLENLRFEGSHIEGDILEINVLWNGVPFTDFLIQLEEFYRRE